MIVVSLISIFFIYYEEDYYFYEGDYYFNFCVVFI